MNRTLALVLAAGLGALLGAARLPAQEAVAPLRDLVGGSAAAGEAQIMNRGFQLVGGSKAGDSSFTYWLQPRSGRCVVARTTNGVYASIVFAPDGDCQAHPVPAPLPAVPDTEDNFATVCGVETGGKEYRYRCRLRTEGCKGEGYCRAIVTYPDNELLINWNKGDEIEVTAKGTNPVRTSSSFRDGQTRFELSGKIYFVYRNPERARLELAKLPN